jgi:hypothetical protein
MLVDRAKKLAAGMREADGGEPGKLEGIEQLLCFLEICGVEALAEATVDFGQQWSGLRAAARVLPEPCQAGGGAQLEGERTLGAGHVECLLEAGGTLSWVNYGSMYEGTVVFSDEVAAAFTCSDLRPTG